MRLCTLSAVLLAIALLAGAAAAAEEARLVVLHTTDLHGALTPFDYLADRPAPRGLVRLAPLVGAIRAEGAPVLLLDDGDAIQGGPLVSVYQAGDRTRPEPMTGAMTLMGYDAMAVGNHEFSFGPEARAQARVNAGFPWLAANVVRTVDGKPAFGASMVRTLGAVRVGVVGVTTPAVPALEDSANLAGLRFLPPVEVANAEIARLRNAEHCDVVVLLAHTGLERDPATGAARAGDAPDENWGDRLATEVHGADVLVLGHTHQTLPSIEIGGTLVTQAGAHGEALGRVDLTMRRDSAGAPWSLAERRARIIAVSDSMPDDSALAAFARPYHDAARAALDEVIGEADVDVASPRGRLAPGPAWALVQRAMLEASGADVALAPLFDPAARIAKGPVRLRDAMRLYPYDNSLVTVDLTGADLEAALERSARYFAPYTFEADRPMVDGGIPGYDFDMAEGLSYDVDLTRPVGQRISGLAFRGEPLDPRRHLKVAVSGYRANGGGGFETIARAPRLARARAGIRDLLVETIRHAGHLRGSWRAGWRLLPDAAAAPERPLLDLLVRRGALARERATRLGADSLATRAEALDALARAFGWRAARASRRFAAAPPELARSLEGLRAHAVLGNGATWAALAPGEAVSASAAADWCVAAARRAGYELGSAADLASFRRSLLTGVSAADTTRALTRAQALGMIANARYPQVRVLETTDFHGAILGGARDRRSRRAIGGSAVLAAHIERLRAANPEGTVLLDGGDCFQGTMVSNLQFGRPVIEQMDALHYTAMAVGNHDFDWSADTLARRVAEMRFSALGANMIERRTGRTPRGILPDTAFVRRGVRVGVLGLCYRRTPTVTLPSNVAHLRFEDDSLWAARLAPRLRRQGRASVVLSVGHVPAETDSTRRARSGDLARLARGIVGVDAWFGGHSHNQVLDEIRGAPVLISGAQGQVVGVCDLVVDPLARRVVEHRARLVTTYADEVSPDSAWLARVRHWNADVEPIAATPVGRTAQRVTRGNPESAIGDLVADAMRAAAQVDIAFQNSGGLRADLPEGVLTRGSIYEVMPFDNTITRVTLSGAEVRAVLEEGLRFGRVTQVSGIRYVYDPQAPAGERVKSLNLADGTPLDPVREYSAVCNNFMADGGDNYDTLLHARGKRDDGALVRDALERHVAELSSGGRSMQVALDGRIRRQDDR